ncbi:MAG: SDR family NAD(P)-dependent oxidoreductase [Candidatus Caldatribacteriaceae bacterium]
MEKLPGKVTLITGATRGIGRAIARLLAEKGLHLGLNGRSEEALRDLAEELRSWGVKVEVYPGDLSKVEVPAQIVQKLVEDFGGLDVLINNAGVALSRPLESTTVEEWDFQMAVNARAPFLLVKAALPYLRRSEVPTIINIASVVATKGYVNQAAYTASKHALLGFTKVLAREMHPEGIRVHVISPGGVATDLITDMRPDIPPSTLIQPEEIAQIVWFLLSQRGNAMVDEINVRRISNEPWK